MVRGPPYLLNKPNIELRAKLARSDSRQKWRFFCTRKQYENMEVIRLWDFLRVQLVPCRPLLLRLVRALRCGALSTFWKVTGPTIPAQMLMYGKEASNRKQEIDRQHYTIPNQRPKDKHCGKI